jgi:hypothetical protein
VAQLSTLGSIRAHHKIMKTKTPAIIAVVIGFLCAAFAVCMVNAGTIDPPFPFAVGKYHNRYFWWPMCAAVALWTLAVFGFISHRKHRKNHAA